MKRLLLIFGIVPLLVHADHLENIDLSSAETTRHLWELRQLVSPIKDDVHLIQADTQYLYDIYNLCRDIKSAASTVSNYGAKDSSLQSILSAVQSISTDGLATEETLQDIHGHLEYMEQNSDSIYGSLTQIEDFLNNSGYATEDTLQSVYDLVEEDSEDWKDWRDKFWSDSFSAPLASSFSTSYAKIGFASNSTPEQVDLEYSSMDFFSASLKLIADGNKINSATTMFLKHINEKIPNLKEHDTAEDENRITGAIDEASGKLDSLKQTFDDFSEISFKEDVEDYFDSSTLLKNFQDVDLPPVINITIPSFGSFGAQVLSIQTYNLEGFLDVSRSVFACLYFVILAGFIIFAFKLFVPVLSKFTSLLASVLNW